MREIINNAEEKYGGAFNAKLFLEQLLYIDDLEDTAIDFLREKITKEETQKFFEKEISSFSW